MKRGKCHCSCAGQQPGRFPNEPCTSRAPGCFTPFQPGPDTPAPPLLTAVLLPCDPASDPPAEPGPCGESHGDKEDGREPTFREPPGRAPEPEGWHPHCQQWQQAFSVSSCEAACSRASYDGVVGTTWFGPDGWGQPVGALCRSWGPAGRSTSAGWWSCPRRWVRGNRRTVRAVRPD